MYKNKYLRWGNSMNTYLDEYKQKLIKAEQAANIIKSNDIIDYGMFATKPVDFDVALSKRVGQVQNVAIRGTGTVPPFPAVISADPEQKSFQYFSWYYTLLDRMAGDKGMACHLPFNYHEATILAYHHRDLHHIKPTVWCAQTTPMDRNGCFNFGLGNSHNRGIALWADKVIVEVNENMPRCLGGNDEYVHISEVDYVIEGCNSPVFATPKMPAASDAERKIADGDAQEAQAFDAERFQHAADLPVAALVEGDRQPSVARARAQQLDPPQGRAGGGGIVRVRRRGQRRHLPAVAQGARLGPRRVADQPEGDAMRLGPQGEATGGGEA